MVPNIEDLRDRNFNPFAAAKEPGCEDRRFYAELGRLRSANGVFDGDLRRQFGLGPDLTMTALRHVAILAHRVVKEVLTRADDFSNSAYEHNLGVYFGRSITTMDDPEHSRYRAVFQRAFGPRVVTHWAERVIPPILHQLIDRFVARGRVELVENFTLKFPFYFIHELMALPLEHRDIFQRLAFAQILITFDREHGIEAVEKIRDYLTLLIQDRRDNPQADDFVSKIATAEVDGHLLPDEVVIAFFRQLVNAGGDTSYNGFSTVLAALLTHPEQLAAVRADRRLVPAAIEEALRWNAPVTMLARTPRRPITVCGVTINPGDHAAVILPAANRDPEAYESPEEFNIHRKTHTHVAFGNGAHVCVGRHLARLEMITALNVIFDRLPNLRVDAAFPPPEVGGFMLRSPSSLHVRFD